MPTPLGVVASQRTATATTAIPTTGLGLWLDADDASTFTYSSGVSVSEWRDKSGGNHHGGGVAPVSQGQHNQTINSVPAVHFNNQYVNFSSFAAAWTAGELFMVIDLVTENTGGELGAWGAANNNHYPWSDGNIYECWGTNARHTLGNPTPALTDPHVYNLRTAPGSFIAEVNGGALFSTASNTVYFQGGGQIPQTGSYPLNGVIGEVIMYSRVLDTAERGQVETYLAGKWGITIP